MGSLALPLHALPEPFSRSGLPRVRLSLAVYSFRHRFLHSQDPKAKPPENPMAMTEFVDYCAEHGLEGAELTSYYFPKDVTDEALRELRRHCFLRGVSVSGTAVGNNFALPRGEERDKQIAAVKLWIDHAAVLGAPHIRVFAGVAPEGFPAEEARKLCIEALEDCAAYAGARGIFLGVENHGGIVAAPEHLLEIVQAVKSPWLGINLDTGNFHTAEPYADLARCAPYAVNVQVKPHIHRAGKKEKEPVDLTRVATLLREARYQGWVALEYEAPEDPSTAVPRLLASMREAFGVGISNSAAGEWKELFDGKSLAGWKETKFSGGGEVSIKDGSLILGAGSDLTGISFTGDPPRTNYELELKAMRQEGSDFFCGVTIPVGEASGTLVGGGGGGGLVGFSSLDGNDASENETAKFLKFEKGRWYKIRVRVTPEKLSAWIDDEQQIDVDLQGRKVGMRSGEIELSQPFGLASFRTRAAIAGIRIRSL
jgi:sugar phosphate isomerase/epimerase